MTMTITITLIVILALVYLFTAQRFKPENKKDKELSDLNKSICDKVNVIQERNDFAQFLQEVNNAASLAIGGFDQCLGWEKELYKSILRNAPKLMDARIPDTGQTFVHAINLVRSNYKEIERDYFNKQYVQNRKITQQTIYDFLDGDKDVVLLIFKSVISRGMLNNKIKQVEAENPHLKVVN